jgi:hypothetical protein
MARKTSEEMDWVKRDFVKTFCMLSVTGCTREQEMPFRGVNNSEEVKVITVEYGSEPRPGPKQGSLALPETAETGAKLPAGAFSEPGATQDMGCATKTAHIESDERTEEERQVAISRVREIIKSLESRMQGAAL